jgi:hypothetical protein
VTVTSTLAYCRLGSRVPVDAIWIATDGVPDGDADADADGEGGGFGGRFAPTAAVLAMISNVARITAMVMLEPRDRIEVPTGPLPQRMP